MIFGSISFLRSNNLSTLPGWAPESDCITLSYSDGVNVPLS